MSGITSTWKIHATVVTFLAGDTIIDRFEIGEDFYIPVDGTATRWMKDAMNREHCMAVFGVGDFMGESAVLLERHRHHGHQRIATIRAETPCTLIRISPEPMTTILWRHPELLKLIRVTNEQRVNITPRVLMNRRGLQTRKEKKH